VEVDEEYCDLTEPHIKPSKYPIYNCGIGNHVWQNALWLPVSWNTRFSSPETEFMKLDTAASSVGAPKDLFALRLIGSLGKEKVVCPNSVQY
jgi:hypothetical protein